MEYYSHINEMPGVSGEMSASFDVKTGKILCCCTGFWSLRQANAYFSDWNRTIGRIHAAGRPVSALVDLSSSHIQSAEVADIVATATIDLYREGDAIAMLVPTCLAKFQMRRILDGRYHEHFTSRTEAEIWLNARSLGHERRRSVPESAD